MNESRVCNINYDNELNKRLEKRILQSSAIEPQYDPRPICTKYTDFNTYTKLDTPKNILNYKEYNPTKDYYTGDKKPQINYYFNNIDVEHTLRNQFFALQKNDKAFYIPDIKSSLYTHENNITKYNINKSYNNNITKIENIKTNNNCNIDKILAPNIFNNSTKSNIVKL